MLREVCFIPEDNPAHARIDEAELVATGVDGADTGQRKIPFEASFGVCEGGDEPTRGSIDMDGNVNASLLLIRVEHGVNLIYGFVVSSVGGAKDDKDSNGVLIEIFLDKFGV